MLLKHAPPPPFLDSRKQKSSCNIKQIVGKVNVVASAWMWCTDNLYNASTDHVIIKLGRRVAASAELAFAKRFTHS